MNREHYILDVMSGRATGVTARSLRAAMRGGEVIYSPVMALRNRLYDRGTLKRHHPGVPVISVGNITAGGTGKTPVVLWLAQKLIDRDHSPAILTRGYKGAAGISDEARMLESSLGNRAKVIVNSDRVAGAREALSEHAARVLILDDGFQHRRLKRDFDLVLINALEPFGYGHVHPRGLLREPLNGLARASAFLITHATEVTPQRLSEIEQTLRRHNTSAPIYRASHDITGYRLGDLPELHPVDALRARRFYAIAGIGYPQSLHDRLSISHGYVGHHWFPDHHRYSTDDLTTLTTTARAAGADMLVTTEKDWTKLAPMASSIPLPIARLALTIRFEADHEHRLTEQVFASSASKWRDL